MALSRAATILELERQIERSRDVFRDAGAAYHGMMDEIPAGLPFPDGSLRLQQAGEAFRLALRAYSDAVFRLDEFVRTGTLPPEKKEDAAGK